MDPALRPAAWRGPSATFSIRSIVAVVYLASVCWYAWTGGLSPARLPSRLVPGHRPSGFAASGSFPPHMRHTWGQYSPFFLAPSGIDAATPAGCRLTFGLVLSRHGSRFPIRSKTEAYQSLMERVQGSVGEYGEAFEFIKDFAYRLGSDCLTPLGEMEMVNSGVAFLRRYGDLAREVGPVVRASGSDRVVMSARNFTQGFFGTQNRSAADAMARILVFPEREAFNNSLEHGSCPAFEDGPGSDPVDDKEGIWREIWATPIMARLNANLAGAELTLEETVMMDLCPFHNVITPDGPVSHFCNLFSRDEWRGYDYLRSLGKWYGYGNGNALGSTQGVGYFNELIAQLTGRAVRDETKTNSTLDSSPETFALTRNLYADFTHDNSMISVYAALGLYNRTGELPATRKLLPREACGYSASWTVPFSGRMYMEKMQCGREADGEEEAAEEELVRILVNDRVVPLQSCGANKMERCRLGAFVDSLSFAQSGGRWKTCFA